MQHGWREGRDPSADFNTLYYRDRYLQGNFENPLLHFISLGTQDKASSKLTKDTEFIAVQKSICAQYFSEVIYRSQLGVFEGDLLEHYLTIGWREEMMPSSSFSPRAYVDENLFVAALDVSPFYHFVSQARLAGDAIEQTPVSAMFASHMRDVIAGSFDASYYLRSNPDVEQAGKNPLDHFLNYGWREGRKPVITFDPAFYLRTYRNIDFELINPFYHYLTIGQLEGLKPNPIGTRLYPAMIAPESTVWDKLVPRNDVCAADYVVIMPVYKGYNETLAALHSVLSAEIKSKYALYIINDFSPDTNLVGMLESLAARDLFVLERNQTNLGFVRSVNRGFLKFPDKDVILLNTDVMVSGDWLDRMVAHARRDSRVATITPFTNNGTIFSYPERNENNVLELELDVAALDRLAARCNAGRYSNVPTGVGFCFYVSMTSRAAVGIFDAESFGRGYGEENDFCLRAAKAGFRNVLAEDVFVYHVGEVSFGAPARNQIAPGQKALIIKHPDYPDKIRQHLSADATEAGRIRLDLARLAADAGKAPVVLVYHAMTGGVIKHILDQEEALREKGTTVVHLRVGVGDRWGLEIRSGSKTTPYCPNLGTRAFSYIRPHLADLFVWLQPSAIHIHSIAGLDWHAAVGLLDLVRESQVPYNFTLHDYSIVCHRNDLVLPTNQFCGLPDVSVCRDCMAQDHSYPEAIDPAIRRDVFAAFLKGANEVIAPSYDVKARLQRAGALYAISVKPHQEERVATPEYKVPLDPAIVNVVTIGAIGAHKGSRIILGLARDALARGLRIRYHIVGFSDVSKEMQALGVGETGRYADSAEALRKAAEIEPSCILLPSIWPETFSYTLSLAFDLGCPPIVFDIGAPAERVRAQGFGLILPYDLIDDLRTLNDRILEFCLSECRDDG